MNNRKEDTRQPNRAWISRMADLEDTCESVVVGGMAQELGMLRPGMTGPREFRDGLLSLQVEPERAVE